MSMRHESCPCAVCALPHSARCEQCVGAVACAAAAGCLPSPGNQGPGEVCGPVVVSTQLRAAVVAMDRPFFISGDPDMLEGSTHD